MWHFLLLTLMVYGLLLGVILVFYGTYLDVNVDIVLILVILQMTRSLESILIVYDNNIF